MKTKQIKHGVKHFTCFNDLPDEILLMICHYLSPAHVLEAFFHYNTRLFSCISQYRQNIDLTKCSYTDLKLFLSVFTENRLLPSRLTVSNTRIPTQIELFINTCRSSIKFHPNSIRHLSLLECTEQNFYSLIYCLDSFKWLQSLHIVESALFKNVSSIRCSMIKEFRDLIFKNLFNTLIELKLIVNEGIILDKQLCPNRHLKQLTISLQNVDDLYVLLDGLVPNLIFLNVTICQSNVYKRSSLPESWPDQYMSHLIEFQLETKQMVELTFEQLRGIVMPLIRLNKFTLNIEKWISNDQRFVHDHKFEILIDQFMPQLHQFYCSIKTMNDIEVDSHIHIKYVIDICLDFCKAK